MCYADTRVNSCSTIYKYMKTLAIIIPVYNEQDKIKTVVSSIPQHFEGIDIRYVVVVDDGSSDGTMSELAGLDVIIIKHKKNFGLGKTFRDGLKKALELGCDYMVNIDGDGQFDPQDISKLLAPIIGGKSDFVLASRFKDPNLIPQMPRVKYWGNVAVAKIISWTLGEEYKDVSCGFRAYNREAMLRINLFGSFTYTQETILDLGSKGLRIEEVGVPVKYFKERKSRIASSILRYAWRSLKIILRTVRDYKPMKFFGILGTIFFSIGMLLEIGLVVFYYMTHTFSPFKFVGFIGAFLNILGVVIFFLGLIADMLYRIRMNQEELLYGQKKEALKEKL